MCLVRATQEVSGSNSSFQKNGILPNEPIWFLPQSINYEQLAKITDLKFSVWPLASGQKKGAMQNQTGVFACMGADMRLHQR